MIPLFTIFAMQGGNPYLAVAAALPTEEWAAVQEYVAWGRRGNPEEPVPEKIPAFIPKGSTPLRAERAATNRYANVLAGLAQANTLPWPDSRLSNEEWGAIKALERLVVMASRVRFAEGDRHGATTLLLDGLTMARRVRGTTQIGHLVGIACESLALAGIEENLSQLPLAECDRLRAFAESALAEKVKPAVDAEAGLVSVLNDAPAAWVEKGASAFAGAYAKEQAQMRLLRLHMRIEAYRWKYLKLPDALSAAAHDSETIDPITQAPFRYERNEGGYRLFSEGFKGQGPMELRYRIDPDWRDPSEP